MITSSIQLGEPTEHRGIVVAPLFPRHSPNAEYLTLEDALPLGFQVTEIDREGAVPELLVRNPLGSNVLLYDGEELLGTKQNRILNVTVLVGAESETRIPVSCVEQGRWHARTAASRPARHTASPRVRQSKAHYLSPAPMARGVAQSAVWDAVAAQAGEHAAHSPTGAQADTFRTRGDAIGALRRAFPAAPGQTGALLALGQKRLCLDYLSRPEAFSILYPKLLEGYLLDALERLDGEPAPPQALDGFLQAVGSAPSRAGDSAGLGRDLRLRASRSSGRDSSSTESSYSCVHTRPAHLAALAVSLGPAGGLEKSGDEGASSSARGGHHTVFAPSYDRIAASRVTSGEPVARAVA